MSANGIFKKVFARKPKRSTFDLSHDVKLSCDMGQLIPFTCLETIPGDTIQNQSKIMVRLAPMLAPVMHKVDVYTHFFFVPWRLIWDDYEEFITGGEDGYSGSVNELHDQPTPLVPRVAMKDQAHDSKHFWKPGSLADYLGYPTTDSNVTGNGMNVSALPFRAYQLIYDEYYRDENLIEPIGFSKGSGVINDDDELSKLMTLRYRAWEKDYFSSALPWTQKGPQQMVPVSQRGTLSGNLGFDGSSASTGVNAMNPSTSGNLEKSQYTNSLTIEGVSEGPIAIDNSNNLTVDGVQVNIDGSSFSINDLRKASRIQAWLEAQARGGSRMVESLLNHFGVVSSDARLQRPEYLGGGKQVVQISDCLQTSQSTSDSVQGNPSGIGFSYGTSNSFKRTFEERGYIIGIMSVMPKPCYTEGLNIGLRKWDKFDYYWPEFAELGEQEIKNFEVSLRGTNKEDTFGYAPRYAEYKYQADRVHGDFKTSLSYWHMGRMYANQPNLTQEFIECKPDKRIFAVTDTTQNSLYVEIYNDLKARRPMPYLPNPSLS